MEGSRWPTRTEFGCGNSEQQPAFMASVWRNAWVAEMFGSALAVIGARRRRMRNRAEA